MIQKYIVDEKKALILLSGGMDSCVCAYYAVSELGKDNVIAVSTYYGQKHDKELEYTKIICDNLGIQLYNVDLSKIFTFNTNTSALLKGSSKSIDHSSYEEQMRDRIKEKKPLISNAYVPFRNGLFLSYASALALQLGCDCIIYGAHSDDSNVTVTCDNGEVVKCQAYPDCTSRFIKSMSDAISTGTGSVVKLIAPIYDLTKSQVAAMGVEYGMTKEDFMTTWSCYEGGDRECGTCGTCIDKIKALRSIGFTDEDLLEKFYKI